MNIAVCIKMVPASDVVIIDPTTHTIIRSEVDGVMSPGDLFAIEAALELKEKVGGHVVAFTMGPPAAERVLRTALAMGCDDACIMTDKFFAGGDTLATSRVLARGIQTYGSFDILLTGASSNDGATGQVGPMLAAHFDIGHVTDIRHLSQNADSTVEVEKKHKDMNHRIKVALPALFTVSYGCNTPRLPTLRTQRAANNKSLVVYTNRDLQLPVSEVGLEGSPTIVVQSYVPEKTRKASIIDGSPKETAEEILCLIARELLAQRGGAACK